MEANGGMVAGSHKRNELVRIRHDSDSGVSVLDLPVSAFSIPAIHLSCVVCFSIFTFLLICSFSFQLSWCLDLSIGSCECESLRF